MTDARAEGGSDGEEGRDGELSKMEGGCQEGNATGRGKEWVLYRKVKTVLDVVGREGCWNKVEGLVR